MPCNISARHEALFGTTTAIDYMDRSNEEAEQFRGFWLFVAATVSFPKSTYWPGPRDRREGQAAAGPC